MANRQYEAATVFNARIADMRHLWTPSTAYKGQPTQKPNYFAMFLVKKTVAQWFQEPALAGIAAACGKIYQTNPHILAWPVVDGDMPSPEGKSSEFAKGHWLFLGVQRQSAECRDRSSWHGVITKLTSKVGVKSEPITSYQPALRRAVKQNDPRGVKLYLNAVVFSSPGEEIVFANSVSGAELMRMAEQQGLRPAGFSASPGGLCFRASGLPERLQPGVLRRRQAGLPQIRPPLPFRASAPGFRMGRVSVDLRRHHPIW